MAPPLHVECWNSGREEWVALPPLNPGDKPGSISNRTPDRREIIMFECELDDQSSLIMRSKAGIDIDTADGRRIVNTSLRNLETIKTLAADESYEMEITGDEGTVTTVRFTHKKE